MKTYRAAVIGCSRMGAFIDNEAPRKFPISHAAGYEASSRTDLVACSDLRTDVMEQFGKRYGIPMEHQYTDYKEMLAREHPDIVSVATQPEHRSEIAVHAADNGAKAIYAEKAFAASLADADAMVEAVERNGVAFNMGTNRRWEPGFDAMKGLIDSGELGALQSIVLYDASRLFNMSSHWFDIALRLNDDKPVAWVQGNLLDGNDIIDNDVLREDPTAQGLIQFEDGLTVYVMQTARRSELEAICEHGVVTSIEGQGWQVRTEGAPDFRGRQSLVPAEFPPYEDGSSTVRLIEDLAHSLDTGEPTRGGVRVARTNIGLIFGFIESHRRGGARVRMPLEDSPLVLRRDRAPRQPKYEPASG